MLKTLIFDIGKTNKKFFIFDENFRIIESESLEIPEIVDDDGFACDDLTRIKSWIIGAFNTLKEKYNIGFLNFTTYGASLVYLDSENDCILPLYNYLKPANKKISESFIRLFKSEDNFSFETSSPFMEFLNSGFQIYSIKKLKPKFSAVKKILHLPQYCSSIFTNRSMSDFTSVGCHTGIWNYKSKSYHKWIAKNYIIDYLPKPVSSFTSFNLNGMTVGIGMHDSSAALLPYLSVLKNPFMVLSTGTWSICLNPYNNSELSQNEIKKDCLFYLSPFGEPVKASRLFLGKEFEFQVNYISEYYKIPKQKILKCKFNYSTYTTLKEKNLCNFKFHYLSKSNDSIQDFSQIPDYEIAYHQLNFELVKLQIEKIKLICTEDIQDLYIDGGFVKNEVFLKILHCELSDFSIYKSEIAASTALGAAIAVNNNEKHLKNLLDQIKLTKISLF